MRPERLRTGSRSVGRRSSRRSERVSASSCISIPMLTFSPTQSRTSSRSCGVRKVLEENSVSHLLFRSWSWSGTTASTFFQSPWPGVIPAPPSSLVLVIRPYIMRCLSASVKGVCVSVSTVCRMGCICRTPCSQSLILDLKTTFAKDSSFRAFTNTRRDVSSPALTSVSRLTSARVRIRTWNF